MKNYVMRSMYKIESPMWFRDRSDEGDIYKQYMKMHEISLASIKKYLKGDWEFVFWNEQVDDIQQVFQDHFFKIYDFWKENAPCNILYMGPDNFMQLPTTIFGKFDDFMMFNYTDPKSSCEKNKWNIQHEHFFNADVRYYPHTMSQDIWNMGLKMAEEWDFDCWNTEQVILNKMLWDQPNRTLENTRQPHLAYQGHMLHADEHFDNNLHKSDLWNEHSFDKSHIIHFHGSRNAPSKLQLMWAMYKHHNLDGSKKTPVAGDTIIIL